MSNTVQERSGIWREIGALISGAFRLVRAAGAKLTALVIISQGIIIGVALPVIGWLFREALRASGMHGLDMGQLKIGRGFPLTIALIIVIIALTFWLLALQFTALIVLLRWPELSGRGFLAELKRVARKLLRPGSLPLVFYLFLLVPLTGFGFTSVFTRGIVIPSFISGELEKSTATSLIYSALLLALTLLNIRLALTVPLFVLGEGGRPARTSWRLTRPLRHSVPLVLSAVSVMGIGGVLGGLLLGIAILPTALTDVIAPDASVVVAAYSLGIVQVVGFILTGLFTAIVAGLLITAARRWTSSAPVDAEPAAGAESSAGSATAGSAEASDDPAAARRRKKTAQLEQVSLIEHPHHETASPASRRHARTFTIVGLTLAALVLGTLGISTMQKLDEYPSTLVLAHRGFSDGGVENTISGLEAAAAAGADLVEMDVMQTRDGEFVAMHDATLSRLADNETAVKDLTLEELTAITVHDRFGHEDLIPSFAEYVTRAKELGMPLLVEIKLGGADTPDHVERLVHELEELDALDANIYHSLDAPSVEELKRLRPDLTVGYTMAFAAVDVPDTSADFIVVEEWSATEKMQQAAMAAGYGFMSWTVNDEVGMRELLRRGVDGIITDHPDQALAARDEMNEETGLAQLLVDVLKRFVKIV